jgi:4-hydroxy-tetrahydrodipicolinate synthase
MTQPTFTGAFTALVTPFRDGAVDVEALRALVEAQIAGGIDGLIPCGTTGESVTLSAAEHALVVRTVVAQAARRVPVVAGAGSVSTAHAIELAHASRAAGADGLLVVVPYYNKPTQAGLVAHYRALLRAVPMPTILYNIPGRCGVDLGLEAMAQLADVPEIVAVKEATGNVLRSQALVARFGDRFSVLSGDDALTLPILAVGGAGVISVTSNLLPRAVSDVVRLWRGGDVAGARALHQRLLTVHEVMFVESNPGPVKAALAQAGRIAPEVRLPLAWPGEAACRQVAEVLAASGFARDVGAASS